MPIQNNFNSAPSNIPVDRPEQYEKIRSIRLPNEKIEAVYDGKGVGTGFIGITDKRVIIQDDSFVGGKRALTSIPYSKIYAVSIASNKNMGMQFISESSIYLQVGGKNHEVIFRGSDKAQKAHDLIMEHILGL